VGYSNKLLFPALWEGAVYHNFQLDALHQLHPAIVQAHARKIRLEPADVVLKEGQPIRRLVFPKSGMISVLIGMADGQYVEAGMIGRNGVVGTAAAFGALKSDSENVVQLAGEGWSMDIEPVASVADTDERVRSLLFRNERFLLRQAQQTAGCNARHPIPQRLASWLLRLRDVAGDGSFYLTQEYIAQMLGVQRPAVSDFASDLQEKGMIRYRRGNISILDPHNLEKQACECYGVLRRHYQTLFSSAVDTDSRIRAADMD
jgi:CRP-like cAMP-binding protein